MKIQYVTKTLPPYLRSKVAYAPDGKDHADYNSFRVYLLAQDSATPRPPAANGNNNNHRRPSNGNGKRRPGHNGSRPGNGNGGHNGGHNNGPRNTPMKRSGNGRGHKRPYSDLPQVRPEGPHRTPVHQLCKCI